MLSLSLEEVDTLITHLVEIMKNYNNFSSFNIGNFSPNHPTFTFYGQSWNLGTIFSNSKLGWYEFETKVNTAFTVASGKL